MKFLICTKIVHIIILLLKNCLIHKMYQNNIYSKFLILEIMIFYQKGSYNNFCHSKKRKRGKSMIESLSITKYYYSYNLTLPNYFHH